MPRKTTKRGPPDDLPAPIIEGEENGADVLRGAEAITKFLNQFLDPPVTRQTVYKMILRGQLPGGHFGAQVIASKKRLRAHLERALGAQ